MFTWNQLAGFTFIFELYLWVYIVQALTFIHVAHSLSSGPKWGIVYNSQTVIHTEYLITILNLVCPPKWIGSRKECLSYNNTWWVRTWPHFWWKDKSIWSWIRQWFLRYNTKTKSNKKQVNWTWSKFEIFCYSKDTIKKVKRQPEEWDLHTCK